MSLCIVCNKYGRPSNRLAKCCKCKIFVHQFCYGIPKERIKKDFLCEFCKSGAPLSERKCVLCPDSSVNAYKKTAQKKWVHILCAIYVEEARFKSVEKMEPVLLGGIKRSRYKEQCVYCHERNGVVIKCSEKSCDRKFHVTCGSHFGTLKELKDGNNSRFVGLCKTHVSIVSN